MGNAVTTFFHNSEYDCFNTLTTDDVAAVWEREKLVTQAQKRRRYKCKNKYIVATAFKPWDIQVNAAIYQTLPTIERQLREEKIAERRAELQAAHKRSAVASVRAALRTLAAAGGEQAEFAARAATVTDSRVMAVLGLARYDTDRAARYIVVELKEDEKMRTWRETLRAHVLALPPSDAPTLGLLKENQTNALLHYDDRTFAQALEVYDKLNAVVAGVWRRAGGTPLSYDAAYRLLRDAGWKVETAVGFSLAAARAYLELRPRVLRRFHPDQLEDYDPEAVRTYLRRSNFNLTEAESMYAGELARRARAVTDFKADLAEAGITRLPSDRALSTHLGKCYWDPGFAKDLYDLAALTSWDADYAQRVAARKQRQAVRKTQLQQQLQEEQPVSAAAVAPTPAQTHIQAQSAPSTGGSAGARRPKAGSEHGGGRGNSGDTGASGDVVASAKNGAGTGGSGNSHASSGGGGGSKSGRRHGGVRGSVDDLDALPVKPRRAAADAAGAAEAADAPVALEGVVCVGRSTDDSASESGSTVAAAAAAVWSEGRIYADAAAGGAGGRAGTGDTASVGSLRSATVVVGTTTTATATATMTTTATPTSAPAGAVSAVPVFSAAPAAPAAAAAGRAPSDAEADEVDAEEIALQESLFVESEHAALDGYSSEGRLERAEDAREELRRLFRDDARDRDQPLVPAELPCEANTEINKLFSWYEGDITTLEVDAIVCPVPERASVTTALGQHIHAAAGGRLRQELETVGKKWRVGEARITLGYDLPARYVIHVKVPETHRPELMAQCVNAALDLAKKLKMHTVAMPPLACAAPQYPRFNGVHVAALTARRWLDVISNRRTIDKVIFVSDTPAPAPALALGAESGTGVETAVLAGGLGAESDASDSAAFKRILPLYFPGPNLNTDTLRLRYLSYRESYAPTLEDPEFKKMLAKMTYDECRLDEDDGAPGGGHTSIWRNGVRTDVGK